MQWEIIAFMGQFNFIKKGGCQQFVKNISIIFLKVVISHISGVEYKKFQNRAIFKNYLCFPVTLQTQKFLLPSSCSFFFFFFTELQHSRDFSNSCESARNHMHEKMS